MPVRIFYLFVLFCTMLLLFPTNTFAQFTYTNPDGIRCSAFSPDNQLVAIRSEYNKLDVFDLKTRKSIAQFQAPNSFSWYDCSFSPDNRYVLINASEDKGNEHWQYLLDLTTKEKHVLRGSSTKSFLGFCDAHTLYYVDHNTNTIGTTTINIDEPMNPEVKEQTVWTFAVPNFKKPNTESSKSKTEISYCIWDKQEKRFLLITQEPGYREEVIGTIKPGETAITPLPKNVLKATKKFAATSATEHAVLFKCWKPESYLVMDLHTFVLKEAHPFLTSSQYTVPDFNTSVQWWHSRTGEDNNNAKLRGEQLDYVSKTFVLEVENGTADYVFSTDLSRMAISVVGENKLTTIRIYDMNNLNNPPIELLPPANSEDAAFLSYVEAHKGEYEQFVTEHLKKNFFGDGWELVPGKNYCAMNNGQYLFAEPGYQYLAYAIGIDYMFNENDGDFPIKEHVLNFLISGQDDDNYTYANKNLPISYLGFTTDRYFYTSIPMNCWISFRPEDYKDLLLKQVPDESMRIYFLRKKTNSFNYGAINFDELRTAKPQTTVSSTSSSSSSRDECGSRFTKDQCFELMHILESQFDDESSFEVIASEIGSGIVTQAFNAPDYDGRVHVVAISTSPCNEIVLYNTTANTFEAGVKKIGNSSTLFKSQKVIDLMTQGGIYATIFDIDNGVGTGTKFQATVRSSGDRETKGVSYICVYYEK